MYQTRGWMLIQYDYCPYQKERFGQRHTERKDNVTRHKKTAGQDTDWNRSSPHSPQKETALLTP